MKPEEYLEIVHTVGRLRDTLRHCYTPEGRRESVAEHSFRISLMAMMLREDFPEADIEKVMEMCLIHDLGECFTGDIPVFNKTKEDESKEQELLLSWMESLPHTLGSRWRDLYQEMEELISIESKLYKALDKLEAVIAHNESDIGTWEAHEYELNLTYGFDMVGFSEWMKELREEILKETRTKISNHR